MGLRSILGGCSCLVVLYAVRETPRPTTHLCLLIEVDLASSHHLQLALSAACQAPLNTPPAIHIGVYTSARGAVSLHVCKGKVLQGAFRFGVPHRGSAGFTVPSPFKAGHTSQRNSSRGSRSPVASSGLLIGPHGKVQWQLLPRLRRNTTGAGLLQMVGGCVCSLGSSSELT